MASDNRVKLTLKGNYDLPLRGPASGTLVSRAKGIIFPYTPTINHQNQVEYGQYDLVHVNYNSAGYTRSKIGNIQVIGDFINQTETDARYTIAVMHFIRTASKMHFGADDPAAGTPPPILNFSAYGFMNFMNVPVVITDYTFNYPNDTDYVKISGIPGGPTGDNANTEVNLPVVMTISIGLMPIYRTGVVTDSFRSLDDFASGNLYSRGFI
jgi:hypothetical protein